MKKIFLLGVVSIVLTLSVRGAGPTPVPPADEAWGAIQKLARQPLPKEPAQYLEQAGEMRRALVEFEKSFPSDPRRWDAKLVLSQVESGIAQAQGQPTDDAAFYALTKQIVAAPDAAEETKKDARYLAAERRIDVLEESGSVTNELARAAVEAAISDLRQNNPDDVRTLQAQFDLARILKMGDPAATQVILQDLAGNKNPQAAALAQQQLAAMQFTKTLGKEPLDLKFDAVDGTKVDLAKLRGKVVLLDFWATWCGPCRMEIPNVVTTYKGLHGQGFEIVGISLDQDKAQMMKFTEAAGMTWPEYFDGKNFGNDIGRRFGVDSIPAMWLLDKKGAIRSTRRSRAESGAAGEEAAGGVERVVEALRLRSGQIRTRVRICKFLDRLRA